MNNFSITKSSRKFEKTIIYKPLQNPKVIEQDVIKNKYKKVMIDITKKNNIDTIYKHNE
jgi:hypothetical protein